MDALLILKCIFVGTFWALAIYVFIGLLFMHFPIPQLMRNRNFLARMASRRILENEDKGLRFWNRINFIYRFIAWLLVGCSVLLYAYTLHAWMQSRMVIPADQFWLCYLIAIAVPVPVLLYLVVHFIRHPSKRPFIFD
jgi:hypothetical protein